MSQAAPAFPPRRRFPPPTQKLMIEPMLPTFTTARLRLEPLRAADGDRLHGLLIRPEVRRYLCDDVIVDRAQVDAMLREAAAHASRGLGLWSLATSGGDWIGVLGLQPVSGPAAQAWPGASGEVEPLIALHPGAWGRGYAGEALSRAVVYAFDDLGRGCLVALVDEPNERSRRLLERAGFAPVGARPGPTHPLRAYSLHPTNRRLDSRGAGG